MEALVQYRDTDTVISLLYEVEVIMRVEVVVFQTVKNFPLSLLSSGSSSSVFSELPTSVSKAPGL